MVLAEGGTAGPADRPHDRLGPLEVDRRARGRTRPTTRSCARSRRAERWWSKGHGTLVEGRDGKWYIVYHAYENGFYTLGRQTLLEPIEWTADGWFRTAGGDPASADRRSRRARPVRTASPSRTTSRRTGWASSGASTRAPTPTAIAIGTRTARLVLKAKGTSPADCSPLWFVTGDHAYEIEVEIDADPGRDGRPAALLQQPALRRASATRRRTSSCTATASTGRRPSRPTSGSALHIRIRNDRHIVTMHYSADGRTWQRVRPRDGAVGLPPQRGVRVPEPAARALRGRHWRGAVPPLQVPRLAVGAEGSLTRLATAPADTRSRRPSCRFLPC